MKQLTTLFLLLGFVVGGCFACKISPPPFIKPKNKPVENIQLPDGFQLDFFVEGIKNARSMTRGDQGIIFVGTRGKGNVYAVIDNNQDYEVDTVITIAEGKNMPNGVAFKDGSLYLAEVSKIWRYDQIESELLAGNIPEPTLIKDDLPTETAHGWKYISFGPDGKLYIPIGAPCNICNKEEEDQRFASICRMNPDGSNFEVYVHGVRNSVGFDWHPITKELWFTENGRDWLGDNEPPCELNRVTQKGQHFGYPFCHGGTIPDPEFGKQGNCSDFVAPAQNLGPHVAPLGMHFYEGDLFPEEYRNQIFIAEHGSWNRSEKIGYRITLVRINEQGEALSYEPFAEGWLNENGGVWGRPVAFLPMPDGSLLISDDFADSIYRLTYE